MRKIGMMLVALFVTVALVGCGEPEKPKTTDTSKSTGGTPSVTKTETSTSTAK